MPLWASQSPGLRGGTLYAIAMKVLLPRVHSTLYKIIISKIKHNNVLIIMYY
jgi:hypothetical protein